MKKKKIRKIKSKPSMLVRIGLVLVVLAGFAAAACTSGANRLEVRIEIKNPTAIDFDRYDKILYKDLALEWPAKDYSPREELKTFFVSELSRTIEKDVKYWDSKSPGADEEMPAGSLLITGKISLEIKERKKIKEVKDEQGNPKNVFVAIQHWDMTMALAMKDISTGKDIFKQDFTEKLNDVDSSDTTTKFNFEKLFFKMTNRLLLKIKKTKKFQRRYLLL